MKKFVILVAAMALLAPAAFAASVEIEANGMILKAMPAPPGWNTEMPTDLAGENKPDDPANACCRFPFQDPGCDDAPGVYAAGDDILINHYWNEVLTDDGSGMVPNPWVVDVTSGLRLPNGNIFVLVPPTPVDFGDLNAQGFVPGDELIFCVNVTGITLPGACAGGANVETGHIINSTGVGGGVGGPSLVNSFSCP